MGIPKFSTFIIALVWVGFFAATFGTFIADTATQYDIDDSDIDISVYNQLTELDTQTEELKESAESFSTRTGITDIIGAYFENGYRTAQTATTSLNVFFTLTNEALSEPSLNIPVVQYLKTSIILTVLILLVIGVLLSAILKKDV